MADLEGRGFELVKHNLGKEPPSRELLSQLIDEYGLESVVSTRSPAFIARGLDIKKMTKAQALDLTPIAILLLLVAICALAPLFSPALDA